MASHLTVDQLRAGKPKVDESPSLLVPYPHAFGVFFPFYDTLFELPVAMRTWRSFF